MLLVLLDILRRIMLYERPRRLVVVLGTILQDKREEYVGARGDTRRYHHIYRSCLHYVRQSIHSG